MQVGGRVVDQHDGHVDATVDVGQHRGDPGDLVGEEDVLRVRPAAGMDANQAALANLTPLITTASSSGRTLSSIAGSHQGWIERGSVE